MQSGIIFLHQLLSPTQYLPSSVGSPLFRTCRAQPLVAVIASAAPGDYYPDPDPDPVVVRCSSLRARWSNWQLLYNQS